jgi:hypothetical protein
LAVRALHWTAIYRWPKWREELTAEAFKDVLKRYKRGDIIVTAPGTSYTVTYYKPKDSPQLLAKRIASADDPRVAMTLSEFLAEAWRLANNKARELGWIV